MDFPNIPIGEPIGLDYETTGLKYWQPDFQVLSVGVAAGQQSWYFDFRENPRALDWLKDTLHINRPVKAQNAQFDFQCSRVLGIDPHKLDWYCTMVHECLINEHRLTYDLDSIARYNGVESRKKEHLDEIARQMGWSSHQEVLSRFSEIPAAIAAPYGASDAILALQVWQKQEFELANQELHRVSRLEMDLLPVLADMSWVGIRVDLEAAYAAIPMLDQKEYELQKQIEELAGSKFNVNSTPQIRAFFKPEQINKFQWRLIDGTLVGPTKNGGGPSINQDVLKEMNHPMAALIRSLRKAIKLRDTFIRGHVIGSADQDGYVHAQFNQTRNDADAGTVTGRLSCTDPALQQITKRDKENAAILRAMFLPDDNEDWLCTDYSQVDFRCAAHLINDPAIISAYRDDPSLDYHQVVSDMTGIPRNAEYAGAPNTKQINLGLAFGAGAGKLAFMMKMPYTISEYRGKMAYQPGPEAKGVFELYHGKLPGVKQFMKRAQSVAEATGYVRTQTGRRLRFPRGIGAHKAAGLLYQANAADLHKYGLVKIDREIRTYKLPARLMMSCHDEAGVSMKRNEEIKRRITKVYTDFGPDSDTVQMRVPITASGDFGPNWWEASKS